MKKKLSRKLMLHRETVRTLQGEELREVNGGYPTEFSCENSCDTATRWHCTLVGCG